ncbi:MAG TPA: hypothetical protein VMB85_18570 [Bryobacteraceae bacterium]|nr:hypothetical protein [Bryobacteraceae bacterium]
MSQVDSRDYIIAYELHSRSDAPGDFAALPGFQAGLFLPRARPDWFGRFAYPPRVIALVNEGLLIVPHPATKAARELLRFDKLAFVESGRILLEGWIRFGGEGFDRLLSFNTRSAAAVDRFLRSFKTLFLPEAISEAQIEISLDLKFRNALAQELEAGESVRAYLFRPVETFTRRFYGVQRTRTRPADLLACTTRRLLWITDRDGQGHAPYGSIARYAPLAKVTSISPLQESDSRVLRVAIGSSEWRIPVASAQWDEAFLFSAAVECATQSFKS